MAENLKKLAESGKLCMGTEKTIKNLKQGKISSVFVSTNCPKDIKQEILRYAKMGNVEVEMLEINNEEFGIVCKKPFSISVAGLLK